MYCVRTLKLYRPTTADGFGRAKNRQKQIKRTLSKMVRQSNIKTASER